MIRTAGPTRCESGRVLQTGSTPRLRGKSALQRRALPIALLGCVLALGACTNSKFLIKVFYNRVDNQVLKGITEYMNLDESQVAEAKAYIGTVHTWHRRTQLPLYADLIRDVTSTLSTFDQATPADFERFVTTLRSRIDAFQACHPARFIMPLGKTLTTEQIDAAEVTRYTGREERRMRFGDRTQDQRIARSLENIDTWTGRLGFDLKDKQLAMIEETIREQRRFGRELRVHSDAWWEQLFVIGRQTDSASYQQQLSSHIDDWFGMGEREFPEEWQFNRDLWTNFAIRFEKSLSRIQRRDALRWLNKFANTLDAVSGDTPDWLPADDPAYGCVVEAGTGAGGTAGVASTAATTR